MERRTPTGVDARLESATDPSVTDPACIENISNHGARVITVRSWRPNERLQFSVPGHGARATVARVVYSQALPNNRFALGLEFDEAIFDGLIDVALKTRSP